MNVLHLTYTLDTASGWGRLSREVITRLAHEAYSPTILTESFSNFPNEKPILGRGLGMIRSFKEIRRLAKNSNLIHSWEANPYGIASYIASFGLRKKHVITATGAYSIQPLYNKKTRAIVKQVYRSADAILCISRYIKDEIDKIVPGAKTQVITLGVDFSKFSGARIQSKEPFILSVGNIGFRKGYHIAIPAFAEARKRIPDLKYYIAGSTTHVPGYFNDCVDLVKKLNLEDSVIFLGSCDDQRLKELYLSAELFLLPSVNFHHHFEGFGLVFLEAASAGLPVIGTTGNGIADAVNPGKNGLLVAQNDISATADAICDILIDPNRHAQFSSESIRWASVNSWEHVVTRYKTVYQAVLAGR